MANRGNKQAERRRKRLLRRVQKLKNAGYQDPNGIIRDLYMPMRSKELMFSHQLATIARGGLHDPVKGIDFHPEYPFLTLFKVGRARYFRKEAYCFMYYLVDVEKIAVCFNLRTLRRSLAECYEFPTYHMYMKKFFEFFAYLEDWWLEVDEAVGKGEEWGIVLLGKKFTTPKAGDIHVTWTWLQYYKDDPLKSMENDREQLIEFRRKMLAENGVQENEKLSINIGDPIQYTDYPTEYVNRLQYAQYMYETNTQTDTSAEGFGWTSESSFEFC